MGVVGSLWFVGVGLVAQQESSGNLGGLRVGRDTANQRKWQGSEGGGFGKVGDWARL